MVAAQTGTATFVGKSGRYYNIDVYLSDVAAAPATFNASGAAVAGSLQYFRAPEQVVLVDFSIITGLTATVALNWTQDGAIVSGTLIRMANQLNTNPLRPKLAIGFPAGALIGAIQV